MPSLFIFLRVFMPHEQARKLNSDFSALGPLAQPQTA